ncbi:MAG: Ferredoxin thioredoxin reductase beta chain [Methanomicrobiales archaeon 53_19]|jgi:ferredoxin-thioredoxin reductase catalytic subunit|uniref:ferredoxin-thioredoxin reductase catalytic domain-containing protein n=1 Tax=Methanocalculus sp. TaxID=2004547 RepID=UPI00074B10E6|nr:ferredoxin-thioredoxin reductase catalytic domain-containing protein [Methanocalculus sp.]KUK69457.1 MAG: Ferredoxin thioredoxin reductase beta chain [Methanocalculus sp. 52_23]KUL05074.1 MAG: Ferredoxin thioredoxin reductase beta chain [Methanomicrobiales archaeon 53_19]HIJ07436.1 ferredoxin:thioredoxin reductase [Methanocalculus sp.]
MDEIEAARLIRDWVKRYAEENGYVLNPDPKQLDAVIRGLARKMVRNGERYCPCRILSGDPDVDKQIICPCIYHKDEIDRDGHCHCNLFFRE